MMRGTKFAARSTTRDVLLGLIMGIGLGLLVFSGILFLAWPRGAAPAPSPLPSLPSPSPVPTVGTLAASPTPPPTAVILTPLPPLTYTVKEGDTLWDIAARFDTTVQAIQAANSLSGELIYPGQVLVIPSASGLSSPPVVPTPVSGSWQPSILEGNLETAYPAVLSTGVFTLHYPPGTEAAEHAGEVADIVDRALAHIEQSLTVRLGGTFDVYVAGTLFAPPDQALRGRSFSARRQLFVLYDGTGSPADRQYIVTHELTHLVAWNTWGQPSSALLSEGLAVYIGMTHIADSTLLSPEVFCTAYDQAGQLPSVSAALRFEGHIRDLPNYYTAGCFVRYLVEAYGMEKLKALYPSGNYTGVYGRSLASLEEEWRAHLRASPSPLPFPPGDLIEATTSVRRAYDDLFAHFTGTPEEFARYRRVDAARIALLEGRLQDVWACLSVSSVCPIP